MAPKAVDRPVASRTASRRSFIGPPGCTVYRDSITLMSRILVAVVSIAALALAQPRPRAPELGIPSGTLARGPLDAITDVAGVRVGHTTVVRGDNVRTGVTVILPHSGNLFRD